jgi:hypothetical protein
MYSADRRKADAPDVLLDWGIGGGGGVARLFILLDCPDRLRWITSGGLGLATLIITVIALPYACDITICVWGYYWYGGTVASFIEPTEASECVDYTRRTGYA